MKTRILIAIGFSLLLGACAGGHSFDGDMRQQLVGQNVSAAVQKFGTPKGQYTNASGTTYVWQKQRRESIFGPSVTAGRGYNVLNSGVYWQGVTYDTCTVRATAQNNVVSGLTFEGTPGGCDIIFGGKKPKIGRSGEF